MRTESALASKTESPIADAVSKAYQVFDRYLQEGQEYAAGHSAWYSPATSPNGASGAPGDLVNGALWLFEQMRALAPPPPGGAGLSPLGFPPAAPPLSKDWPQPRWPNASSSSTRVESSRGHPLVGTPWVEETFEDDPQPARPPARPPAPPPAPPAAPASPTIPEALGGTPLSTGFARIADLVLGQADRRSRPSR